MEDIFKARARTDFLELIEQFLQNIRDIFPECQACKDFQILFTGSVKTSESKTQELIEGWYSNMMTKLTKKVKYAKAIERILDEPGVMYHTCQYNDIDGLEQTSQNEMMLQIEIFDKYRSENMSESDRKVFWKYINEINLACFKSCDKTPPYVPSRDEIQKNIKSKKTIPMVSEKESPSMNTAFKQALRDFCEKTSNADVTESLEEDTLKKWVSRWASYAQDTVNGQKVTVLCNNKDIAGFIKISEHFSEFILDEGSINDDIWNSIVQLNGYATVGESIPTNMMGKIENLANKLANDIVNGRTDLSSMNLNDIGQEVLSQCDESDMSKFADNIENLLPALQSFQKGVM